MVNVAYLVTPTHDKVILNLNLHIIWCGYLFKKGNEEFREWALVSLCETLGPKPSYVCSAHILNVSLGKEPHCCIQIAMTLSTTTHITWTTQHQYSASLVLMDMHDSSTPQA